MSVKPRLLTARGRRWSIGAALASLALALGALIHAAPARAELTLRTPLEVNGDIVTVGDLFHLDDAHAALAATPVARSPEPGQSASVSPEWLAEVLARRGVRWSPPPALMRVTIARRGVSVGVQTLEQLLAEALAREQVGGPPADAWSVRLHDPSARYAPVSALLAPEVTRLRYDARAKRVSAQVRLGPDLAPLTVSAQAEPALRVLTPTRPLARGERVSADSVATSLMPASRAPSGALTSLTQIEGLAARRALRPGQAISAADVAAPPAVTRGDSVMLSYRAGRLTLTMRVRALETAPLGAVARFQNLQSNRTIEALVTGPGQASVSSTEVRPS